MASATSVDPNKLNAKVAEKLKELGIVAPPFVNLVKSGSDRERPPEQEDFFYIRCASILGQLYKNDILGVRKLRTHYGKRKKRGVKPEKHGKAGGSIIRKAFKELERVGLVEKITTGLKRGRKLTPKGRSLLDQAAKEISS